MEKWTDRLTIDMIPEQYRQLAEITGIQPLLTLAAQYGGSNLYISKVDALTRTADPREVHRLQRRAAGAGVRPDGPLGAGNLQGCTTCRSAVAAGL